MQIQFFGPQLTMNCECMFVSLKTAAINIPLKSESRLCKLRSEKCPTSGIGNGDLRSLTINNGWFGMTRNLQRLLRKKKSKSELWIVSLSQFPSHGLTSLLRVEKNHVESQ